MDEQSKKSQQDIEFKVLETKVRDIAWNLWELEKLLKHSSVTHEQRLMLDKLWVRLTGPVC